MNILNKYFERRMMNVLEDKNKRQPLAPERKAMKDFVIKTIGLINSCIVGRENLVSPEFDFEEIKRASETDSYIKISLDKYKRLIFKAGYYLKSENESGVEYLKTRFRVMSYATNKPMDVLFQEIADDVITYSNAFIVKTRVDKIMPGVKAKGLYGQKPIGGYSRIDPSTVYITRDEFGNILQYVQKTVNGKEKKYKPSDIIHIYMNKESSNAYGTPKIIAAMEDVKLLRRLEGHVLAIVHRFAIPVFHWKVGKPEQGFQATDKEIEEVRREIENASLDGHIITNEKTEIKAIGAEGNAINVAPYLTYFEQRVMSALDTSTSQMGRGGAKQDADSMESQAHDYIKYVQKVLSIFLENYVLGELLLEGGFDPVTKEKDIVQYVFNEIDLETKIKVENHELLKYQSNMQSLEEARRNIGYKEEVEVSELYKNLIEVPAQIEVIQATAKAQTDTQIKVARENAKLAPPPTAGGTSPTASKGKTGTMSNGKKSSQAPNKDASSRNKPSNQHGSTSVKVKEGLDFVEAVARKTKKHKKDFSDFYKKVELLSNNISGTDSDIDVLISIAKSSLEQEFKKYIIASAEEGVNRAIRDMDGLPLEVNIHDLVSLNLPLNQFFKMSEDNLTGIFKDMKKRLKGSREFSDVDTVITTLEYRFRFMIEFILSKAEWYAYLKAGQHVGYTKAKIEFSSEKDKDMHNEDIDLRMFRLEDIPAFHPFCKCQAKFYM